MLKDINLTYIEPNTYTNDIFDNFVNFLSDTTSFKVSDDLVFTGNIILKNNSSLVYKNPTIHLNDCKVIKEHDLNIYIDSVYIELYNINISDYSRVYSLVTKEDRYTHGDLYSTDNYVTSILIEKGLNTFFTIVPKNRVIYHDSFVELNSDFYLEEILLKLTSIEHDGTSIDTTRLESYIEITYLNERQPYVMIKVANDISQEDMIIINKYLYVNFEINYSSYSYVFNKKIYFRELLNVSI